MNAIAAQQTSLVRHITRAAQQQIKQQTGMRVTLVLCAPGKPGKTPEEMLLVIAGALKMSPDCYGLKDRSRNVSELRFIAALFLRKHFPALTLQQIGVLFGGRDHSSVLYCLARAKVLLAIKDLMFCKKYATALKSGNQWLQATEEE